ncbi:unnamed protein product [Bemisia tabaci]|uniref:Uncharacterized protein n=1 Tax=Bemisia tabaci TaxID=7038 RepID=A0A9P0F2L4_BEMTA|nr:unnamed protein product [Bemisia tabaci]
MEVSYTAPIRAGWKYPFDELEFRPDEQVAVPVGNGNRNNCRRQNKFTVGNKIWVTFTDNVDYDEDWSDEEKEYVEESMDAGGPRLNFFSMVLKDMHRSSIFEGPEGKRSLAYDSVAESKGLYLPMGQIIAYSLSYWGPGPSFFSDEMSHVSRTSCNNTNISSNIEEESEEPHRSAAAASQHSLNQKPDTEVEASQDTEVEASQRSEKANDPQPPEVEESTKQPICETPVSSKLHPNLVGAIISSTSTVTPHFIDQ